MMEDRYRPLPTIFHDLSSILHFLLSFLQSPPAFPPRICANRMSQARVNFKTAV